MSAQSTDPRSVVVIGASSGIGLAAAREFARAGDHLVLSSRSDPALEAAAEICRADGAASVRTIAADAGVESEVAAMFEEALAQLWTIDVVVHTATVMAYGSIEALPAGIFETVTRTAIEGTFHCSRAALRIFRAQRRGTLIIVNSLLGQVAVPQMGAYVTAKFGQAGLIRTLQIETRDEKEIRVCSVAPGGVNTPIYTQAANVTGRTPRPPIPVDGPDKIARAIAKLATHPRARVSVGPANSAIVAGFRLFPQVFDLLVTPLMLTAALTKRPARDTEGNVIKPRPEGEAVLGRWTKATARPWSGWRSKPAGE
jgi:NAD(P)-dependent dehydrogenase (short-subunit alcohol dehydrogenase family)